MKIIESHYVSIGQASKIIGLSIPTLRRYEKLGKLDVDFRTFGNHRRYHVESLKKIFSKTIKKQKPFAMLVFPAQVKKMTFLYKNKNYLIIVKIKTLMMLK